MSLNLNRNRMESIVSDFDRKAIDKLKSQVSDLVMPNFNDFDFLRWLQGHDYNYDFIVPNMRHHFRFMRSYDFSKMRPHPIMEKYWPSGMLGLSGKDNNFVFIECTGRLDGEGVLKSASIYDILLSCFCGIESVIMKSVRNHENETGRQSGVIMIQDLDQVPLNSSTLAMAEPYRLYLNALITHYAEVLRKFIFINAPTFMQILWRLIKPILPEKTKKKVIILGSDWRTEILKHVDANALPVHWGGTLVDENNDPKCASKIVIPTKVPTHLYWCPNENEPATDELTHLIVPAGCVDVITVEVGNVGNKLRWYFFANATFGFGVFYTENEDETHVDKMEMVYPQIRLVYAPSIHPERDEIECKKIGFYKLWFSNESSWLTKLKINYKISCDTKG